MVATVVAGRCRRRVPRRMATCRRRHPRRTSSRPAPAGSRDGRMKLSVEFPSVAYREGPDKVVELARAIEGIGFDDLAMFDHVVMGHPTTTRRAPMYPPQMPILEAFVTLAYVAAVTSRVTLSTEVLVLPQRQATL